MSLATLCAGIGEREGGKRQSGAAACRGRQGRVSGGGGEVVRVECGVGVLVASLCACRDEREAQCWVILAPAHPGSDF